ncbi:MAG: hypothetical protein K8U57_24650 [Planctomycetes bacterium]|nr:hypothetical protein [Planctomycetota bacterium]
MKLSAPPPPPPPPEPNQAVQPTPNDNPEASSPTQPPPEGVPPVPPVEAAKTATWPVWFSGADFVLAVAAVVLAFLVASFVARNSDIYLHLAAGQRLLAGTYTPGSDPFSFAAADRAWVNHSLLFDVGTYLLYSGNGSTLGVLKAIAVAAAFGLLIGIRRPGYSLWPWAMIAVVGIVATAPYAHMRPVVGSMLLLAVTLFLLFRLPHQAGSWRFPIAIGVTFWVWSNTDEWFFLGPMALALVLIGELIQRSMRNVETQSTSPPEAETLGALPDVKTLTRALGIGVVVCMLNPHHVRVWELPFELVGAKDVADDIRFKQLLLTPLDSDYTDKPHLGYNQNGLAFALLFVGGGAALGLAGARIRISLIALWVGFAVLTLGTIQAIPFLAMVAVPIIASQLNAISSRISLKSRSEPKTQILLLGSSLGRVVSLIAVLGACVVAWPGWIHPPNSNPAFVRRVAWGIEPDAGMVKGAEQLQAMRKSGQLPADSHGFITLLDFANYCAWFAPDEKVYANTRYNHHRPELPGYMTVRRGLQLILPAEPRSTQETRALNNAALETLLSTGSEYVVLNVSPGDSTYIRPPGGPLDWEVRGYTSIAAVLHWLNPDQWSPWYIDGRTAISGWRPKPGSEKPTFAALRLRPSVLAFAPGGEQLPAGAVQQIRPQGGWEDAFIRSPGLPPPSADESLIWHAYRKIGEELQQQRVIAVRVLAAITERVVGTAGVISQVIPLPPANTDLRASAFLALRAARRAIAADPQHPDGYFALFRALDARELSIPDDERTIAQITALRQCLERMPPPEEYKPGVYAAIPSNVAMNLAALYLGPQQNQNGAIVGITGIPVNVPALGLLTRFGATISLVVEGNRIARKPTILVIQSGQGARGPFLLPLDLAREVVLKAQEYAKVDSGSTEAADRIVTHLKGFQKVFETDLAQANNAYESRRAAQKPPLPGQIQMALQNNLTGEALRLLKSPDLSEKEKEFGPALLDFLLLRVSLELAIGALEDAAADLEVLQTNSGIQQRLADPNYRTLFQLLVYQKLLLEGNYADAGRVLEELDGPVIGKDPLKATRDQFDTKFYLGLGDKLSMWAEFAPLTGLLAPTPFDLLARIRGPGAALGGEERGLGYLQLRNDLANRRNQDADFYFRRGLLFLYEGDMVAARKRFLQTRLPAVKEWGLLEYRNGTAELYIRLIDEAEKAAPAK